VEQYLYALQADPCELTNPVGLASHRRAADVLRERLLRLLATRGEAPAVIDAAAPRPSGQWIVAEEETLFWRESAAANRWPLKFQSISTRPRWLPGSSFCRAASASQRASAASISARQASSPSRRAA